ncbi:MAG: hypothetical protein CL844_03895 [Crocinitomicaceae bacterium]|nr:hypothetical protein [Crocinitomicaceae bacterium]
MRARATTPQSLPTLALPRAGREGKDVHGAVVAEALGGAAHGLALRLGSLGLDRVLDRRRAVPARDAHDRRLVAVVLVALHAGHDVVEAEELFLVPRLLAASGIVQPGEDVDVGAGEVVDVVRHHVVPKGAAVPLVLHVAEEVHLEVAAVLVVAALGELLAERGALLRRLRAALDHLGVSDAVVLRAVGLELLLADREEEQLVPHGVRLLRGVELLVLLVRGEAEHAGHRDGLAGARLAGLKKLLAPDVALAQQPPQPQLVLGDLPFEKVHPAAVGKKTPGTDRAHWCGGATARGATTGPSVDPRQA